MLDKLKSLSKDTMIYGTSTIIGRFLNFLLVPIYTNIFLPGEFGIIANIYAYIAILNVFFTIGLESGFFKFASTLEAGSKKENFSHPFFGILFNSLVLSSILFLFSSDFAYLFQIDASRNVLIKYTAIILFFDAIVVVPFANLRLQRKPKLFAVIKISNIAVNVICNLIFLMIFRFGIESVFYSNLISSIFTFLLLIPIIFKNITFTFNKQLFKELLRFSLPYIPAGISSNIIQVINRPILTALTNESTVGIFQANYKLGILMMLFVSMFEFAWRPFFLQNAKETNAKEIFSKVMTLFIIVASFIFLTLSLFIDNIAQYKLPFKGYLIGKAYWGGLFIVPIILLSYFFYGIYINLMAGIYIEKKTKYLPFITGIAAAINVLLNFILIPKMGMMGCALTTLFSYIAMVIGIYLVSQKYYFIKYEISKIISIFILLAVFYGAYIMLGVYAFWYIKLMILVCFTVSIFIFRVIDIKSVKAVIKFK
ncbi:MAG: oligosaccharide flippase family protein [Ignavibacteriae bacterium]|nr:oligosaccharide flippase family protein [Ignavibacteriota bacterium]